MGLAINIVGFFKITWIFYYSLLKENLSTYLENFSFNFDMIGYNSYTCNYDG